MSRWVQVFELEIDLRRRFSKDCSPRSSLRRRPPTNPTLAFFYFAFEKIKLEDLELI
jgi:hypothetical protein